jgi:hypothetical protein
MALSAYWRSNIALITALGMTSATALPLVSGASTMAATPASFTVAQLFPPSSVTVPEGTVIPVRYDEAERIIVTPDETADVTLTVASDIRSRAGTVLIPRGSLIEGELRPLTSGTTGTQFVSEEIVLPSDRRLPIDATSEPITETEIITERSNPDILRGAAIGAAAAAVLAEVLGDIDIIEVLGGAGLGALGALLLGGNREEVEVVVIEPETDLDLTLQSDFEL